MNYVLERYYIDKKIVSLREVIITTTQMVATFSDYYYAELLSPKKGVEQIYKSGKLPTNFKEKEEFIQELVEWIFENSICFDLFSLFLDNKPIKRKPMKQIKFLGFIPVGVSQDADKDNGLRKFDHRDDTYCWTLNISQNEFQELKNRLSQHKLPEDLFYSSDKNVCTTFHCYSPKEWQEKQESSHQ
jgi:hypothetical protein